MYNFSRGNLLKLRRCDKFILKLSSLNDPPASESGASGSQSSQFDIIIGPHIKICIMCQDIKLDIQGVPAAGKMPAEPVLLRDGRLSLLKPFREEKKADGKRTD